MIRLMPAALAFGLRTASVYSRDPMAEIGTNGSHMDHTGAAIRVAPPQPGPHRARHNDGDIGHLWPCATARSSFVTPRSNKDVPQHDSFITMITTRLLLLPRGIHWACSCGPRPRIGRMMNLDIASCQHCCSAQYQRRQGLVHLGFGSTVYLPSKGECSNH